jgi:hypothetical protein
MTGPTTLEKIAREICAGMGMLWSGLPETKRAHYDDITRDDMRGAARAAVEAMREPGSDILRAAQPVVNLLDGDHGPSDTLLPAGHPYVFLSVDELAEIWHAAIDAILDAPPQPIDAPPKP